MLHSATHQLRAAHLHVQWNALLLLHVAANNRRSGGLGVQALLGTQSFPQIHPNTASHAVIPTEASARTVTPRNAMLGQQYIQLRTAKPV
jgi:hypothetical protein